MNGEFNFKSKTFNNFIKDIGNRVTDLSDKMMWTAKFFHFMGRPIGIINKDKYFIVNTLKRNIGNCQFNVTHGMKTSIGDICNPYLNSHKIPWYLKDEKKKKSSDYLNYLSDEIKDINISDSISPFSLNSIDDTVYRLYGNPNRENDTRIAVLAHSILNEHINKKNYKNRSITKDAYINFSDDGNFGRNSLTGPKYLVPRSNEELIGNIIDINNENNKKNRTDFFTSKFKNDVLIKSLEPRYSEYVSKSILGYDLLDTSDINPLISNKKYYYYNGIDKTYLNSIDNSFLYKNIKFNENNIRFDLIKIGNPNIYGKVLYTYAESEGNHIGSSYIPTNNEAKQNNYITYDSNRLIKKDIIKYTNDLFNNGKIDTLIGRFHSNKLDDPNENDDITNTATSKYGISRGRNLLKLNPDNINGYDNPYCRVWTFHNQYSTLNDTIRPFQGDDLRNSEVANYRTDEAFDTLRDYGVKGSNKLVRIAPKNENDIKKCMFSIENLAWKGEEKYFEHYGQKGPLGGRIMWFPPYDLKFSENVSVSWSSNQFIGRGENIYTYTNTDRGGNLSFKLLIDHPSVINSFNKNADESSEVDDVNSTEQTLLRFFAGCEVLSKQKHSNKDDNNKIVTYHKAEKIKPSLTLVSTYNEINFYVFFPNNYSGIDDGPSSEVPAMEYLINGKYTNYFKDENNKAKNLPIIPSITGFGYEMSENGISNGLGECDEDIKDGIGATKSNFINEKEEKNIKYVTQEGKKGRVWGYRVDKRIDGEFLKNKNYTDNISYQLNNNNGYERLLSIHTDAKKYKDKGTLYSFNDVFKALDVSYQLDISEKSKEIKKLINEFEVKRVEIVGYASSHGKVSSNKKLASDRARSVIKWLQMCNSKQFNASKFKYINSFIGNNLSNDDINSFEAKSWRCVRVTIKLEKEGLSEKVDNTDISLIIDEKPYINNTYVNPKLQTLTAGYDLFHRKSKNPYLLDVPETDLTEFQRTVKHSEFLNEMIKQDIHKKYDSNQIDKEPTNFGYRNEYEFFKELDSKSPFLHNKIVDKIKYFDPAFHSITPEGFQSRLTFLHQCTRQGNTSGASDLGSNIRTAKNLAFGRPPICVLRIGDFYNTKIIIESLNIEYDDASWDLNDEGIGVMPMLASVHMTFKFLGGSDLRGPIDRLQNALSFNHYANTSLYDTRSETILYENGKIKEFNSKN